MGLKEIYWVYVMVVKGGFFLEFFVFIEVQFLFVLKYY